MKNIFYTLIFFLLSSLIFTLPLLAADGSGGVQPYILDAGEIYFDYQQEIVTASGMVSLEIADLEVKADKVEVNLKESVVKASGGVELITPGERVSGTALEYDYSLNTGIIYSARTRLDDLRFEGGLIRFHSAEEYSLEIKEASFTPCIMDEPHYHIQASRILFYPEEKIVGKRVEFYFGRTRIITLPGYVVEYVKTPEGGEFVNPFPLPRLGYNTSKGFSLEYYYPYEYNDKLKGSLSLNLNQSGEGSGELEGSYRLSPVLTLEEILKYSSHFNEDDELEEEGVFRTVLKYDSEEYDLFTGIDYDYLNKETIWRNGLDYQQGALRFSGNLDYNLSTRERQEMLSLDYSPESNYSLAFYQEYTNELLEKYSYQAGYQGKGFKLELLKREGYDYDYHPQLAVSGIGFALGSVSGSIKGGIGRVENEGVRADRLKSKLKLDYPLNVLPQIESSLSASILNFNYRTDSGQSGYRVYQLTAAGGYQQDLREELVLEMDFKYDLTVSSGDPVLPDDEITAGRYLIPSLKLTHHYPEPESTISLELTGELDLENRKLEEAALKLVRSFDCYSYSVEYSPLEKSLGFSINM